MACFLVSAAEAAVVTAIEKVVEKKEESAVQVSDEITSHQNQRGAAIPLSRKLQWLTYMLWGGAILLAFEHLWHGEVVPWFPFLTAMTSPDSAAAMFGEMATVGVCMALLITAVWFVMCKVADAIVKRPAKKSAKAAKSALA